MEFLYVLIFNTSDIFFVGQNEFDFILKLPCDVLYFKSKVCKFCDAENATTSVCCSINEVFVEISCPL